jgi:hypothetical protein
MAGLPCRDVSAYTCLYPYRNAIISGCKSGGIKLGYINDFYEYNKARHYASWVLEFN